ncbi:hypothetical protein PZ892_06600 [Sphingobacterium sp. WM]|uniref:hypothetical protein n=1 Tax=Sphingobacterium sp. WM TaxID=3031802 RepID=UPI00240E819C|nr:hypothetical protein [Sphingobacterium sp. WM]WFB64873.1 hypothetical protein PZ892_06600 [Sphingobacterium sp. WM]
MNVFFDVPSHNITDQSGYLELRSKISMLYLNRYIRQLIKYTLSLHMTELYSTDTHINVHYDSDWSSVANQTTKSSGFIVFDKDTKAIVEIANTIEHKEAKRARKVGSEGKTFIQEQLSSKSVASFYKTIDGKYSLQSFDLDTGSNIYDINQTI